MKKLAIYTDGSSLGNPGPGGWGSVLLGNKQVVELGEKHGEVTNNQMELLSLYKSFEYLIEQGIRDYEITVHSDSTYVVNGLNDWIHGWKLKDWKTAAKKPVLNKDLWQDLDRVREFVETDNTLFIQHIKAHAGHEHNERADDIARGLAEGNPIDLYSGPTSGYKTDQ